jgi:pteridine reductase
MNLQGASILITGGRRVGRELALHLARRGARIAMTYNNSQQTIEATVEEVERLGARGLALQADLAIPEQALVAVDRTVRQFGRLDALINMASTSRRTPFDELDSADESASVLAAKAQVGLLSPRLQGIARCQRRFANAERPRSNPPMRRESPRPARPRR